MKRRKATNIRRSSGEGPANSELLKYAGIMFVGSFVILMVLTGESLTQVVLISALLSGVAAVAKDF